MAGIKALVALAFSGSIGMTLVILACALPISSNWWPIIMTVFYFLAPLPTMLAQKYQNNAGSTDTCKELSLFITAGIVVSAFALPIVLARSPENSPIINWTACMFTLSGNVVVFLTILGFFIAFEGSNEGYNMW